MNRVAPSQAPLRSLRARKIQSSDSEWDSHNFFSHFLFSPSPPPFPLFSPVFHLTALAVHTTLPRYPPPSLPRSTLMVTYSPLNGTTASSKTNRTRLWLLFGGLVVIAFLSWPSSPSLPHLSDLPPSFTNHFTSSATSPPTLRVDDSTGSVPVADSIIPSDKWWQDISVVYTWVNGSETSFLEDKQALTGQDPGANRFRDDGLFRYSVRSVEKYLPWHKGEIILLSRRNHLPDWIDASNPR